MVKNVSHIRSFHRKLSNVDARIGNTILQKVTNFKKSTKYMSKLKQVFANGSKSFQNKRQKAKLDLASVDELIKCNFGSEDFSKVTHSSSPRGDQERAGVEVDQLGVEGRATLGQTTTPSSASKRNSHKSSS